MATDIAKRDIDIDAPLAHVLATLRDLPSQTQWVREIRAVEVLQTYDEMPVSARFDAVTPMGTDEYTLAYEHSDTGMSWSMLEGTLQTGQDGHYTLEAVDEDRTRVTFELAVSHTLPLPGFLTRQAVDGVVTSTLAGLKRYVEAQDPAPV